MSHLGLKAPHAGCRALPGGTVLERHLSLGPQWLCVQGPHWRCDTWPSRNGIRHWYSAHGWRLPPVTSPPFLKAHKYRRGLLAPPSETLMGQALPHHPSVTRGGYVA